jgi:hypothetical protein
LTVALTPACVPKPQASVSPAVHVYPLMNPECWMRDVSVEPVGLVWAK